MLQIFKLLIGSSIIGLLFPLMSIAQSSADQELTYIVDSIPGTDVSFKMVKIPAGVFMIGSPESEEMRQADEGPQHQVSLPSFWMSIHELTFEEYDIFRDREKDSDLSLHPEKTFSADAASRPSPPYEDPTFGMGKKGFPAASMTQYAALKYCRWLYQKTGVFYRLPTEAEWEYACRAGSETAYPIPEGASLEDYAWFYENSEGVYHPVGEKKPNAWGLYDMMGNVSEWTLDQYKDDFYVSESDTTIVEPWSKPTKLHPRTVKGGSYDDDPEELRAANRIQSNMAWKRRDPQLPKSFWWNTDSPFVGFRLVKPDPQPSPEAIKKFWKRTIDE